VTPTRTLSPEELAAFQTPTIIPVGEPPTPTPQEIAQVPTQDVTPTFVTAEAAIATLPPASPLPVEGSPQAQPTFTPTIPPTVAISVTLAGIVTPAPLPDPLTFILPNIEQRAFAISTDGGLVSTGFALLNDTVLFERNPRDPNQFVTTDSSGNLYLTGVNGAGAYRPDMSPFSVFIPASRAENNAYVAAARWSPDGQYVAFIVAGRQLANDGVWFFQPGFTPPLQLLVDCPSPGFPGCGIVNGGVNPDLWESINLDWSPSSDAILVTINIPSEGRRGLIVLQPTSNDRARDNRPPVYRYDYGTWTRDGSRLLVSGRAPDGRNYVAWLNRDGSFSEMLYEADFNGLWMGFANQASNGQVYALGAPGGAGGPGEPLRIYAMNGQPLTGAIGEGFPERVEWSPDGQAVFVQGNGRQFIARVDGTVVEITQQVAGTRAINWVQGGLPPSEEVAPPPQVPIPLGVIEGSEYQPGQQLRVYTIELNMRTGPGTGFPFARNFLATGEYVAILAGPVEAEGIRWWQVQTADGVVGWVAGAINGSPTLGE
jgi:hypothetical protein